MFKTGFQYSCLAGSISAKSATEEEKNNRTTQHLFLSSPFQRHAVISTNTQSFMGPTGLPSWTNTEEIQSTISGKQCDSVVLFSKRNDPNSLSLVMNGKILPPGLYVWPSNTEWSLKCKLCWSRRMAMSGWIYGVVVNVQDHNPPSCTLGEQASSVYTLCITVTCKASRFHSKFPTQVRRGLWHLFELTCVVSN